MPHQGLRKSLKHRRDDIFRGDNRRLICSNSWLHVIDAPRARTPFRRVALCGPVRAGFTQAELGERIGLSQRGIANWEIRPNSSPNAEQLALLADVLEVSVEELVRGDAKQIRIKPGPRGKLLKLFHEVSELPKGQQKDVAEVLQMFVRAKKKRLAERQTKQA